MKDFTSQKDPLAVRLTDTPKFFGFSAATALRLREQGEIEIVGTERKLVVAATVRGMVLRKIREKPAHPSYTVDVDSIMTVYYGVPALVKISAIQTPFPIPRRTAYRLQDRHDIITISVRASKFVVFDSIVALLGRSGDSSRNIPPISLRVDESNSCSADAGASR